MTRDDPAAFAPPPAFGPFRVLHQIGVGALGPVFRTYEPTRDRLIAVKVFRLDVTPEQAQALADELSQPAEAGLFHPSIVEPVAAGVQGTVAYRAEEYVAAESLDGAIRHYAPATPDKVLPLVTQLAGAIDFARAAGVGHGALHLRDVFVTPDEARAGGFGVVEAMERTGLRAPVRRPYSAPERIAGVTWGTPADVFSLAAIAFELLTGRRAAGTGDRIGPLEPHTVMGHGDAIHAVLARAMDEEPSQRYPSALAFASALEAATRGERVTGAVAQVGAISGAAATAAAAPLAASAQRGPMDDLAAAPRDEHLDDIDVERDEDAIHHSLAEEDRTLRENEMSVIRDPGSRTLFDEEDEALEDLAIDAPPDRFADEFTEGGETDRPGARTPAYDDDGAETAAAASILGATAATTRKTSSDVVERGDSYPADSSDYDRGSVVEPPRPAMLPIAVTLVLALLVGFAAGYAVGTRSAEAGLQPAAPAANAAVTPPPQQTPADPQAAAPPGRAYSEQAVTPNAAPPVPAEVPEEERRPPASRPAAPAATTGSLVIQSTPSRANVTINGQWRGRTPLTLSKQPFRRYNIRVVQNGYGVSTEDVTLTPESPSRTVTLRLQRAAAAARTKPAPEASSPGPTNYLGSIYVDSRPRGARVILNGKPLGATPMRIPEVGIGAHVIRLELENHRTWTASTRVQAGQETRVTGSLERIR